MVYCQVQYAAVAVAQPFAAGTIPPPTMLLGLIELGQQTCQGRNDCHCQYKGSDQRQHNGDGDGAYEVTDVAGQ